VRLVVTNLALQAGASASGTYGGFETRTSTERSAIAEVRSAARNWNRCRRAFERSLRPHPAQPRRRPWQNASDGFQRECNRDGAGPVRHPARIATADSGERGFHQCSVFGAWDKHIGRDAKVAAVEFLAVRDVLRGLAVQSLVEIAA